MFHKQTVQDIELAGETVLLRADYNVPLQAGRIADDYRIRQSLPTINYVLERGAAKLVIASHLGRPAGPEDRGCSLAPVAARLGELLGRQVAFAEDCVGQTAEEAVGGLPAGGVLLLQNLRYHPEEEANDDSFAGRLASLATVFVQDGFGVVHRAHASTEAITHHLPSVSGLLLHKEFETITRVMQSPDRPLLAIVGGAKIADKIEILERFVGLADAVAIGGAMANTFLAARGHKVGASLYAPDDIPLANKIMAEAERQKSQRDFTLLLPADAVIASEMTADAQTQTILLDKPGKDVPDGQMILDIGERSARAIADLVQPARTVVINGTVGVAELRPAGGGPGPFENGTHLVVQALLGSRAFVLAGGGDTVSYLQSRDLVAKIEKSGHVSTGGGASLELIGGHKLPGVEALRDK